MAFVAAMFVDLKRCIGCNACSLACKQENDVGIGQRWMQVYGAEQETYPKVFVQVLPMTCQQCANSPCKSTCDGLGYKAIIRRPDGILYVDPKRCTGCQACVPVCPYKAMTFNTAKLNKLGTKGVAEKCHFCMHRLDAGLLPACVITCQGITLDYGDFSALQKKYPQGKEMGDDFGPKVLYGNMGDEPKRPTAGYPDPVPCHDDD
jgi:Fe-S-cluster-containing dehydrogenase component